MAQAKPACGSHPHGCNANVLSIQYNNCMIGSIITIISCYTGMFPVGTPAVGH